MQGKTERHSRHLYDIHKIVTSIGITDEMKRLVPEVKAVRSNLSICPSAREGVSVTKVLYEIIDKQVYKMDYENITLGLLFVPETYQAVIQSIRQLAESGMWD